MHNLQEDKLISPEAAPSSRMPAVASLVIGLLLAAAVFISIGYSYWVTLIAGLIIAGIIVTSLKPVWGLYAMAISLPVINLNIHISWLIVPLTDLVGFICLAGFLLHAFFRPSVFRRLTFPFLLPFLLFFAAALTSSLVAPNPAASAWYAIRWILFFYAVYVFLPSNIIKDKKTLISVLISFVVAGLGMALLGVISLKDQNFYYDPIRFTVLTIRGLKPFGLDQNLLVESLLPAIFFIFALETENLSLRMKRLLKIIAVFMMAVLLGTFSRGGWLSFALCGFIYLIGYHKVPLKKVIAIGAIAMVLLLPFFVQMFRLQTADDVGGGSNRTRLLSTQIAFSNFLESPLVGKGAGEYVDLINENVRFRAQHGEGTDANGFIQKIMAENGLLGLVTFALLAIVIFYKLFRSPKNNEGFGSITLPIVLGALSIFLFEFFNTSYYHGKLWFPIGIAWAAASLISFKRPYEKLS